MAVSFGKGFKSKRGGVRVDPRLMDTLETAANLYGLNVEFTSGVASRSTGTTNHPGGYAVDVQLSTPDGTVLPNYQNGATFPAYERFAQTARVVQQAKYPDLDSTFRWGGYFRAGPNPMDLMHFDINPKYNGAMGAGTWDKGVNKSWAAKYGVTTSNPGLASTEGQQVVSSIRSSLANPGSTSPGAIVSAYSTPTGSNNKGNRASQAIDSALGGSAPATPLTAAFDSVTAPAPITPHLMDDGSIGISGRQPMPASNAGDAGASSFDRGLGATADPRTAALLQSQDRADPIGNGPGGFADLVALAGSGSSGPDNGTITASTVRPDGTQLTPPKPYLAPPAGPVPPAGVTAPATPAPAPQPAKIVAPSHVGGRAPIVGSSYRIQAGDTLSGISARTGIPVDQLASMNGIDNPNFIVAGHTLQLNPGAPAAPLPRGSSVGFTTAPAPAPAAPGGGGGFNIGGLLSNLPKVDLSANGIVSGLGSALGTAANGLGTAANTVGDYAKGAPDAIKSAILSSLGTVAGRSAILDPMMASLTSNHSGTIYSNPNKYGATSDERRKAAADRAALMAFGGNG